MGRLRRMARPHADPDPGHHGRCSTCCGRYPAKARHGPEIDALGGGEIRPEMPDAMVSELDELDTSPVSRAVVYATRKS